LPTIPTLCQSYGMERDMESLRERIASSPLVRFMGIRLEDLAEGYARLAMKVEEKHLNSLGTLHGGVMATLNDIACGVAINTVLIPNSTILSLDLRVEFIDTLTEGTVYCEGFLTQKKRAVAFAHSRLVDSEGRLLSTASATGFIRRWKR